MSERQQFREKAADLIEEALAGNRKQQAVDQFVELHSGDQVEVFSILSEKARVSLIATLDISATADLFSHQDDSETLEAAEGFSIERLADVLDEMDPDEAADLLGDLPSDQASKALQEMEATEDVLPLLDYSDETAGGRMTTAFIFMHRETTAEQAIENLRKYSPDNEAPYYIFVTDQSNHLAGVVGLRELVVSPIKTKIESVMTPDVIFVYAETDQEEVARVMQQYDLSALPVVDEDHHLVGVVTHDDILDVLTEEATEDIYRLANVGDSDLEPESDIIEQLRGRLPWLYLNSLTALFASWVISNFESLIAQVAVLAVFQSVVTGQGGNAGSQSVAIIVRSLALGKISPGRVWRILARQLLIGLLQGISVGLVVGIGVYLWKGNVFLGIVLGFALVGNMLVAAIAGTVIPLGLKAIGQDPALASSVLVTAATDSLGFLIFLGLATYFLENLI